MAVKTVSCPPDYSRIFDKLIHEAKFEPHSGLLVEMLEYGKRLHNVYMDGYVKEQQQKEGK